jgi:hypothetical protein
VIQDRQFDEFDTELDKSSNYVYSQRIPFFFITRREGYDFLFFQEFLPVFFELIHRLVIIVRPSDVEPEI